MVDTQTKTSTPSSRVPHLKRYQEIASVFARHGFGSMLHYLQLERHISLPAQLPKPDLQSQLAPAEHFRLALEELGPTFVKVGQMLTTRPDLLGPEYVKELSKLQDDVSPASWEAIHTVLVEELGDGVKRNFKRIDHHPLAAASLGQVHLAMLKTGEKVVVKIQRPDIQATIETDLEILRDLASLAENTSWGELNHPEEMAEEFSYSLLNELNYRREGNNADRFCINFADDDTVHIPMIYWENTTRRVLVMERIQGIKVNDIAALDKAGYNRKNVAQNAANIMFKEVLEYRFFHADPHAGNYIVMPGEIIGVFDFGLMGELSVRDQKHLSRLYIGVISLDTESIIDELIRMEVVHQEVDRSRLNRDVDRMLGKYKGLPLNDVHMQDIFEDYNSICSRHHLSIPSNLWLLGKTLTMTEGLGLQLDPDFDFFAVSQPYTEQLKRQMLQPNAEWVQALLRQGADWIEFVNLLPKTGRRLLEKAERNELFEIGIRENSQMMGTVSKLVNRFSLSIVIAGLDIGLAILIAASAPGSPIQNLVMVGFIATFILGVWLLISIIRGST